VAALDLVSFESIVLPAGFFWVYGLFYSSMMFMLCVFFLLFLATSK